MIYPKKQFYSCHRKVKPAGNSPYLLEIFTCLLVNVSERLSFMALKMFQDSNNFNRNDYCHFPRHVRRGITMERSPSVYVRKPVAASIQAKPLVPRQPYPLTTSSETRRAMIPLPSSISSYSQFQLNGKQFKYETAN